MTGDSAGRDRDAGGRARNARPRDALGRPLARTAAGQAPVVDDAALPPAQALAAAQELLDGGRPFRAHEVLEAAWKAAPAAERDLWQGLAQLAVGLTHALRGNAHGAAALLRRGADRLGGYPVPGPHEVDVDGLRRTCGALAERIETAGLAGLEPADLRIRLRAARPADAS
jgi:uncharacterized protein